MAILHTDRLKGFREYLVAKTFGSPFAPDLLNGIHPGISGRIRSRIMCKGDKTPCNSLVNTDEYRECYAIKSVHNFNFDVYCIQNPINQEESILCADDAFMLLKYRKLSRAIIPEIPLFQKERPLQDNITPTA